MKKTIYLTEQGMWRGGAAGQRLERAAGEGGPAAAPCWWETSAPAGKVVDLAAWKAENLVELEDPEAYGETENGLGQYEGRELVRRRRRKHSAALTWAELAATLAAAGVMAAMILRVLVF